MVTALGWGFQKHVGLVNSNTTDCNGSSVQPTHSTTENQC